MLGSAMNMHVDIVLEQGCRDLHLLYYLFIYFYLPLLVPCQVACPTPHALTQALCQSDKTCYSVGCAAAAS
jgi:hypothetical protein